MAVLTLFSPFKHDGMLMPHLIYYNSTVTFYILICSYFLVCFLTKSKFYLQTTAFSLRAFFFVSVEIWLHPKSWFLWPGGINVPVCLWWHLESSGISHLRGFTNIDLPINGARIQFRFQGKALLSDINITVHNRWIHRKARAYLGRLFRLASSISSKPYLARPVSLLDQVWKYWKTLVKVWRLCTLEWLLKLSIYFYDTVQHFNGENVSNCTTNNACPFSPVFKRFSKRREVWKYCINGINSRKD